MIQAAALLPIAPILLLPFIIVFFVVIFPIWLVAIGLLWIIKLLVMAIGGGPNKSWRRRVEIWIHWVVTFGGFTEKYRGGKRPTTPQ